MIGNFPVWELKQPKSVPFSAQLFGHWNTLFVIHDSKSMVQFLTGLSGPRCHNSLFKSKCRCYRAVKCQIHKCSVQDCVSHNRRSKIHFLSFNYISALFPLLTLSYSSYFGQFNLKNKNKNLENHTNIGPCECNLPSRVNNYKLNQMKPCDWTQWLVGIFEPDLH